MKYAMVHLINDTRNPPSNNDNDGSWNLQCGTNWSDVSQRPTFWGLKN